MGPLLAAILGAAVGVLVTAGATAWVVRRHLDRLRAAERRARASERMAEIGAMTGGLAHEIKNPLSTLGLNAQLLAEQVADLPIDDADKSRLTRRLDVLAREVERLRGILSDFLQYAGELRLARSRTDLNEVVAELADFFLPQADRHGVRLRTDLSPAPLPADVDAPLIKQALLNLMLNAVQSMAVTPDGTPRELILKTAHVTDSDGAPLAAIHVIDTGPGIDHETRQRIFQPYFTTRAGGTGLGLPTARRVIEAHGGRIDLFSEPRRGSDFVVVVPRA